MTSMPPGYQRQPVSLASVFVMLAMLAGCPHPLPETITISGVVSDDIVVGATVQVKSLTTGALLTTSTTGSAGTYAAQVESATRAEGLSLTASGGKMLGEPFVGTMTALYAPAQSYEQANITLLTTALEKAVANSTDGATQIDKLKTVTTRSLAGGVLPADFSAVAPSGSIYASLKSDAERLGVAASTSRYAASIAAQVTASESSSGCDNPSNGATSTCWKTVGIAGADFFDAAGTNIVHIPGGHFSEPAGSTNCAWKAIVETAPHSIVLRLAVAFNGGGSATPRCTLSSAEDITISLPAHASPALLACDITKRHLSMQVCTTVDAEIAPRYHMASGTSSSYVGGNPNAIRSISVASASARADQSDQSLLVGRLERAYASQLFSSDGAVKEKAKDQWVGKAAVIFVNGFTPGGGFGGGNNTWGQLPNLVAGPNFPDGARFVALNFQWSTDGNFFDAAAELAKAVDYAYLSTNKPVHIVAHSFGGVLARVFLQNIDEAMTGVPGVGWSQSASKVASLTTVGTPHSGIANVGLGDLAGRRLVTVKSNPLVSAYLPIGWAPAGAELAAAGSRCFQVSCYQAGLSNASIAPFGMADIQRAADPVVPGYVAARLYLTRNNLPPGMKVLALIGQQRNSVTARFMNGDGLISYLGQRYLPDQPPNIDSPTTDSLPFPVSLGDAYVTERLLGLNPGERAYEGKDATGIAGRDGFGNMLSGYAHAGLLEGKYLDAGRVREVDLDCANSSSCTHDTWLNLRTFLLSLLGGPASDNFPANIGAATCTPAITGQLVTCTLTGANIPATSFLLATNCGPTPMVLAPDGSPIRRQFTCTAGVTNSVISFSYSADPINGLGAAKAPPRPAPLTVSSTAVATVTRVGCTVPVVNQPMTCTVSGTNLPDNGMTLAATNCSPVVMTQQTGGSATERRFSCTPTLQGNLTITQLSVPGYVGALPTLPSYYTVDSVSAATKLIYVSDEYGVLAAVDVVGLKVYTVGTMTPPMEDIAFSPSGELYGVTPTSLYRINPGTAATSLVGGNFSALVGLGFSPEGILYGVGGTKLYLIDPTNGNATLIGDTGHIAAGDIAFDSLGAMYFSTTLNQLVKLNRATGASTVVGNLGYSNVWGLALARNDVLYGFSGVTALTVNIATGSGTQAFFFTGGGLANIAGATTRP